MYKVKEYYNGIGDFESSSVNNQDDLAAESHGTVYGTIIQRPKDLLLLHIHFSSFIVHNATPTAVTNHHLILYDPLTPSPINHYNIN